MCRAATRCTGSASLGNLTPRSASSSRNRTAPDPAGQRWRGQRGEPLGESSGGDPGLPSRSPADEVKRREDLAAARVEDGEALTPRSPRSAMPRPIASSVQTLLYRQADARGQAPRGGDADPQPGERARAEPDCEPVDRLPAAAAVGRPLDLARAARSSAAGPVRREPEQRLVHRLAVARRRRRCRRSRCRSRRRPAAAPLLARDPEDEGARPACPRRTRSPVCLPGMFEVILFT